MAAKLVMAAPCNGIFQVIMYSLPSAPFAGRGPARLLNIDQAPIVRASQYVVDETEAAENNKPADVFWLTAWGIAQKTCKFG